MKNYLLPLVILVGLLSCDEADMIKTDDVPFGSIDLYASFDLPGKSGSTKLENVQFLKLNAVLDWDSTHNYYRYVTTSPSVDVTPQGSLTIIRMYGKMDRVGESPNPNNQNIGQWTESMEFDLTFSIDSSGYFKFEGGQVDSEKFRRTYGDGLFINNIGARRNENDIEWHFNNFIRYNFVNFDVKINDVYGTDFKN